MNDLSMSDTVFGLVHSYRLAMRTKLKAHEIGLNSMHVRCLPFIYKNNACTANDIVHFIARDKAQIARLIKEMIDNNWLSKTANPEDKRSQLSSLTEEGNELAELISDTQRNVHKKMQENVSPEALAEFKRTAKTIAANLQRINLE